MDDLARLISKGAAPLLIDVRSQASRHLDPRHIPGAVAVELKHLKGRAAEWRSARLVVVYCNCPNDASAAHGASLLAAAGVAQAMPLAGGLDAWIAAGQPVELRQAVRSSSASSALTRPGAEASPTVLR